MPKARPGEVRQYFDNIVLPYTGDGCLFWPYGKMTDGYARITYEAVGYSVSRLICEKLTGPAPTPQHQAAHSCGNGHLACVNPKHLSWKTPKENQIDRVAHGTANIGSKNPRARITEIDVIAIRALRGVIRRKEIARIFGIGESSITGILTGKRWRHVA